MKDRCEVFEKQEGSWFPREPLPAMTPSGESPKAGVHQGSQWVEI